MFALKENDPIAKKLWDYWPGVIEQLRWGGKARANVEVIEKWWNECTQTKT